jgi:hypothetical protein
MKNLKSFLAVAAMFFLSVSLFSQNLDEIVSKHIEAIGGKANWAKINSLKMEGLMKAQGAEIKVTITQVNKKAMRQDISVMGMNGYSIITNTEGWSFMPFQGQTKPEPMTTDDVKNAQEGLYLQDEFITYKELGKKLEYIGKDDVDGTECFKLKMTSKNNSETTFFIDPSNYYIIKQINKQMANGQEQENISFYGNYKKLDEGIVYAMSITSGWGETEVTKLEINPTIDPALFKPAN